MKHMLWLGLFTLLFFSGGCLIGENATAWASGSSSSDAGHGSHGDHTPAIGSNQLLMCHYRSGSAVPGQQDNGAPHNDKASTEHESHDSGSDSSNHSADSASPDDGTNHDGASDSSTQSADSAEHGVNNPTSITQFFQSDAATYEVEDGSNSGNNGHGEHHAVEQEDDSSNCTSDSESDYGDDLPEELRICNAEKAAHLAHGDLPTACPTHPVCNCGVAHVRGPSCVCANGTQGTLFTGAYHALGGQSVAASPSSRSLRSIQGK